MIGTSTINKRVALQAAQDSLYQALNSKRACRASLLELQRLTTC
ncbi:MULTISPECIES: hypothetical protein [Vibrio]|nr:MULTISPECIES: hypothetical protein [Vibrio]MDW1943858.1 hypothetical protein [Vibrio sp. Vb0599]MDW3053209.1 hypothetical protein [Vibrio sp. 1408]